ncbi:hypothetical protein KO361_04320 [Candidatus Woesearchaeota archaeon]|jgi:hypothetical protein|nr:hypothetical protein [Candidatus Woesearchaeota archaeon]
MASQALEQMLETTFVPNIPRNRMYQTIDTYTGGTTQLYSFDSPKPFNPIGSMGSGFQTGSQGNIRKDLGNGLQERYDFSQHDSTIHINYDLFGAKKDFSAKALGDAHKIDLSYLFKDKE